MKISPHGPQSALSHRIRKILDRPTKTFLAYNILQVW